MLPLLCYMPLCTFSQPCAPTHQDGRSSPERRFGRPALSRHSPRPCRRWRRRWRLSFGDVDQPPPAAARTGRFVATTPTAIGRRIGLERRTVRSPKPLVLLRTARCTMSTPSPLGTMERNLASNLAARRRGVAKHAARRRTVPAGHGHGAAARCGRLRPELRCARGRLEPLAPHAPRGARVAATSG